MQHVMDFLSLPQQFIHPPRQCIIREKAEVETNNCNINTGCNTKWTAMQQCGDQNDDKFSEHERALAHQMTSTSVRHPYHSPTQACLRWTAHMFSQQARHLVMGCDVFLQVFFICLKRGLPGTMLRRVPERAILPPGFGLFLPPRGDEGMKI